MDLLPEQTTAISGAQPNFTGRELREICQQWFLVVILGDPKQLEAGQKWMLKPADVPGGQPAGRWASGSSLWSHGWRSQERDQEPLKVTDIRHGTQAATRNLKAWLTVRKSPF